jgi:hypothetical protein
MTQRRCLPRPRAAEYGEPLKLPQGGGELNTRRSRRAWDRRHRHVMWGHPERDEDLFKWRPVDPRRIQANDPQVSMRTEQVVQVLSFESTRCQPAAGEAPQGVEPSVQSPLETLSSDADQHGQ